MRQSSRVLASLLGLTFTLTGCGGQSSSLPSLLTNNGGTSESSVRNAPPERPLIAVPKLSGDLAYTDAGRRAPNTLVRVSITLRYNHQAELDRFVAGISDPHSGSHRHFLTAKDFNEHFAPTREQERRVIHELDRAGFTIVKRYR
ncbi:MAG TPA: protease pro-enzyme activation domain-containing protein, partial [Candidatus Cybelea sp.]